MVATFEPSQSPIPAPPVGPEAPHSSLPMGGVTIAGRPETAFDALSDADSVYSNRRIHRLYAALLARVTQRAGIIMLVGGAGDGKTTLLERLVRELNGDRYNVLLARGPGLTCDGLIAALSQAVGAPPPVALEEWRAELYAVLLRPNAPQMVVIIDQADEMNGSELDRAILRLRRELGEVGPFKLILSGRPELIEALRRPCLKSLHKITRIYRLGELKKEEVGAYIAKRCDVAGYGQEKFTGDAVAAVAQCAGGSIGRINRLCGRALVIAGALHKAQVDAGAVRQAAAELGYGGAPQETRPVSPLWLGALAASLVLAAVAAFTFLLPDRTVAPLANSAPTPPRLAAEPAVIVQKSAPPAVAVATASVSPPADETPIAAIIRSLVPPQPAGPPVQPGRSLIEESAAAPRIAEMAAPARMRDQPKSSLARIASPPSSATAAPEIKAAASQTVALLEPAAGPSRAESKALSTPAPLPSARVVEPRAVEQATAVAAPSAIPSTRPAPVIVATAGPSEPLVSPPPQREIKPVEPTVATSSSQVASPPASEPNKPEMRVVVFSERAAGAPQAGMSTESRAAAAVATAPMGRAEPKTADTRQPTSSELVAAVPAAEFKPITETRAAGAQSGQAPGAPANPPPVLAKTMQPAEPPRLAAAPAALPLATNVAFAAPPSGEALPIRVFLHYTAGRPGERERAARLAEALRGRGLTVADIRAVPQTPRNAVVRFYYDADRDYVRALANALAAASPASGTPSQWSVSDFTRYPAPPRAGNVEVWIPD